MQILAIFRRNRISTFHGIPSSPHYRSRLAASSFCRAPSGVVVIYEQSNGANGSLQMIQPADSTVSFPRSSLLPDFPPAPIFPRHFQRYSTRPLRASLSRVSSSHFNRHPRKSCHPRPDPEYLLYFRRERILGETSIPTGKIRRERIKLTGKFPDTTDEVSSSAFPLNNSRTMSCLRKRATPKRTFRRNDGDVRFDAAGKCVNPRRQILITCFNK